MSGNQGLLSGINRGGATVVVVESPALTAEIDDEGATVYFGWAEPASLTAAASWRILRQVTTGVDDSFKWADGNKDFDNVWDDRATLTYP